MKSSANYTLYNCCPGNLEPDWNLFDALALDCSISNLNGRGTTWTQRAPLHEAEFFTVFGHLKSGGCDAITDITTRKLARRIAEKFRAKIGRSCSVVDFCESGEDQPL